MAVVPSTTKVPVAASSRRRCSTSVRWVYGRRRGSRRSSTVVNRATPGIVATPLTAVQGSREDRTHVRSRRHRNHRAPVGGLLASIALRTRPPERRHHLRGAATPRPRRDVLGRSPAPLAGRL